MKIAYKRKQFGDDSLEVLQHCIDITEEYMAKDITMTLRQLYYQMIGRDLFPESWVDVAYNLKNGLDATTKNTIKNYARLSKLVSDARLAGYIDWDSIEDRGRRPLRDSEWNTLRDGVDSLVRVFRLKRWENQPEYVELWVEKDALASVLEPITSKYHVTLMVNKGYSSQSAMWESANRFKQALTVGKWPTLIYIGDHDPSGEDMVRDIRDRMHMFRASDITILKLALTKAQVKRLRLPPNPAKVTDPRAKKYIAEHGKQSWEVDAIPPDLLHEMVDQELRAHIDWERWEPVLAEEERLKKRLVAAVGKIK